MSQAKRSDHADERRQLENQLRLICASIPAHIPTNSHDDERVIFDFVYKDMRCVLFRTQAHHNQSLSPREQEIVRLVASGHPNKVIAAVLEISYWTVGTHLRRIFAKMGVTSRAAMVARFQEGFIDTIQKGDDIVSISIEH